MRPSLSLRTLRLLAPGLLLLLAACGGGGTGDGPATPSSNPGAPAVLTITTAALPAGSAGNLYADTHLAASNITGTPAWTIDSGSLPTGITVSLSGLVSGTPEETGAFAFVVRITDDIATDTQNLLITVDVLGVNITSGLTIGDAWSGRPVLLAASGNVGSVTYGVTSNDSGGSFTTLDPVAGTATWVPGPTTGAGVTDQLRATDTGSGQTFDVEFPVMPDPAAGHTARFGTTDVWFIDPTPKTGTHAYASDFHQGLADAGFRAVASTDPTGTEADQLADLWIRIEVLRQLNPMFLRNADGTPGSNGIAISFPLEEPGAGYSKAAVADSIVGGPTRYSVMAFIRGSQSGVIGTAFLDNTSNGWHENDTSSGSFELGVFTNQIVPFVNSAYSNSLPNNPITAADVPALEALLYELPSPGGRYNTLRTQGRGLARSLAAVLAHEIGHSLGLDHTSPSQTGSIMNPSAAMGPSVSYQFVSEDVTQMRTNLPGTGKSTGGLTAQKTSAPGPKPVEVCHCRACIVKARK